MFEPLNIFDDNWMQFAPMSPEEEENAQRQALKEQHQGFLDIFRRKLEEPGKPMQYTPDYNR